MSKSPFTALVVMSLTAAGLSPLHAQEHADDHAAAAANNPLANMTSFQLQNYYAPELYGLPDETSNTAWLRFVKPFGKVLVRASLLLPTVPTSTTESISGVGDFSVFAGINLQLLSKE